MPRTRHELEQAAAQAEAWLDSLDPDTTPAEETADLRRVGLAVGDVATAERKLAESVAAARDNGRSWAQIAMVLGISRQAAQERYSQFVDH